MDVRKEIREHKVRTLKTFVLCLIFIGLGIYGATPGVTLLDLQILTNTSTSEISAILPARSGGYACGAALSSFITLFLDHQICLMLALALSTSSFAVLPYFQSINVMLTISFLSGVAAGCIDTIGNVYTIYLWRKKAAPFVQMVHLAYGLGAFISPMIANPFLLEASEEITELGREIAKNYVSIQNATFDEILSLTHDHKSHNENYKTNYTADDLKVHWAYIIISIFNFSVLVFFIIVYLFRPVTKEYPTDTIDDEQTTNDLKSNEEKKIENGSTTIDKSISENNNVLVIQKATEINEKTSLETSGQNDSCEKNEKYLEVEKSSKQIKSHQSDIPFSEFIIAKPLKLCDKILIWTLSILFFHLYCGLEISFGSLLSPFAVKSNLKMTKSEGSFLTSTYWGMFTFFRLFSLFAITYFSPRCMLMFSMSLIMLSNVFLLPFANYYQWALWYGSALMGLGCSSVFATMFAFVEQLTPVTTVFTSITMVSCCLGEFIIPFIVGLWIDTNPEVYLYVIFIYSIFSFFVLISLFIIQHYLLKSKKYSN